MDPKYDNCNKEKWDISSFMHHGDRMKRALTHIHAPVKAAVARYTTRDELINPLSPKRSLLNYFSLQNSSMLIKT